MIYVYALLAALAFGAGDFLGGLGARRSDWSRVAPVAQTVGLVPLLCFAFAVGGSVSAADTGWSIAAGIGAGLGVCLLYRALAEGQMGVVAPVTALCAIMLPSLLSLATEHAPTRLAMAGIAMSVPALALISCESPDLRAFRGIASGGAKPLSIAVIAGMGIAALYICLKQTAPQAGLWPAVLARVVAASLCCGYVVLFRHGKNASGIPKFPMRLALSAGALDGIASAFLLAAIRNGNLATMATLTSLYPAATILLAWIFLKERMNTLQKAGLCLAAFSTVAIVHTP
jgi:uncharacterized membrane protein